MQIAMNTVVSMTYELKDADGNVLESSNDPVAYLHGGYDNIFPKVEEAMHGKKVGDVVIVDLQPADAFGEYDPELVNIVSVDELPQPLKIGMQIEGNPADGGEEDSFFVTVTDIADGKAVLDANHPLAGISLVFNCTVQEVRPATPGEIAAVKGKET